MTYNLALENDKLFLAFAMHQEHLDQTVEAIANGEEVLALDEFDADDLEYIRTRLSNKYSIDY
jgi:hypothetical protein